MVSKLCEDIKTCFLHDDVMTSDGHRLPLYLSEDANTRQRSSIVVLPKEVIESTSTSDLHRMLHTHSIVVPRSAAEVKRETPLNPELMQRLRNLHHFMWAQGQSSITELQKKVEF